MDSNLEDNEGEGASALLESKDSLLNWAIVQSWFVEMSSFKFWKGRRMFKLAPSQALDNFFVNF